MENEIRQKIHRFLDGELTDIEADQLWAELLDDKESLDYYNTLTTLGEMGRKGKLDRFSETGQLPLAVSSAGRVFKPGVLKYLAAAAVLLAGLTILFTVSDFGTSETDFEPLALLEYPIERSESVPESVLPVINEAYVMALEGSPEDGIDLLQQRLQLQENSAVDEIEIVFAIARIHYNQQQFSEAGEWFVRLTQYPALEPYQLEQAYWYLANTLLHRSQTGEAAVYLHKVIELDGAYIRMAKQAVSATE